MIKTILPSRRVLRLPVASHPHITYANRRWQSRLHFKHNIMYVFLCVALQAKMRLSARIVFDIGIYVVWH